MADTYLSGASVIGYRPKHKKVRHDFESLQGTNALAYLFKTAAMKKKQFLGFILRSLYHKTYHNPKLIVYLNKLECLSLSFSATLV